MSTSWKTIRVFISSTFKDMQAERDHLVRFVFPRLRERLLKYRIHLVDVDLRWGVTGKEDASEACREVIGECRPRFLCILGGRYGWVPPPKRIAADAFAALLSGASAAGALTPQENEALHALYSRAGNAGEFRLQKKPDAKDAREVYGAQCKAAVLALRRARLALSITADEIDFAVLNPPSNNHGPVRAFFFFRHEAATNRMVEEKAGDFCERAGSDAADDLAELKMTIADSGHTPRVYGEDAQWDATAKRLVDLEKFGEAIFADLLQSIKDDPALAERFSPEAEAARNETSDQKTFADEADAMDAFIDERTERFVTGSREPLLRDLLAFATADGAQNLLVLTGDPGSGKSALLAKFCRSLAEQTLEIHNSSFILHHFVGASPGSTDLRRTLCRLCHILAPAEPLPQDLKELTAHFHALLARTKQRVILVLDALNQLDDTDGAHWLNWLPPVGKLPPHVRIIASVITPAAGEEEHRTLAILRNRKDADVRNLKPLSWRDSVRIMRGYLRRFSKRLDKSQKRALLAKSAGRLPLYILTALEELRTLGTDEQLVALASQPLFPPEELERLRHEDHDAILTKFIATELPGTAVELFRWILKTRLSKEPILATHPHGGAAGLVEKFAACLGVSRHGLSPAELTALLDPGDPLGNVAALLRLLRPYLMRRSELLDFFHSQFREAAEAEFLDTKKKQHDAHVTLANHFELHVFGSGNAHALVELPFQQAKAGAMADLQRTLTNLRYLHERTEHCDVRALVDDFGLLDFADTRSSGAWREFLIRHAERLSHHRGLLFALVFYEGFDAARGQAEELSASGKWRKAWFRATKGWQPRQLRQEDYGWTVHVETECHSRGHSVAAIAGERGMAFHFQRLGQVGLTDLGSGQRLDYLLFVAQQLPLAMCCTTDGTRVVVAFENGDGEIWRISFDDAGRIAGCSAEPILFRYRVPEFEKPVLCVSGGRLWYQQESGLLAARSLFSSDVSECPVPSLIDLSWGELSSLCAVGLRMAGTFRTDGDTQLFLLDEGHMAALVRLRQVDVVTACPFGDDAVALALTDYSIRLLKVETAFTLLAQVKALPGNPRLSPDRLELTESPSVIVAADGGLFWITRNGHLFGWRPSLAESPAEIDARELELEGPLAFDARPDGHFHVVTSHEARFSVGPGAGDARASVLAVFADPASCGDYRAFYEEDAGVAFVESSTRSTRIVETGLWRPYLSACDGTGCILGMNAAGQAMLIRLGDEEVTRAEYAVYGVASVAGHPDSGFWLADGVGTLWFLAPRHGISSVHRTQMADVSGQGLWCGRDLLVRSGVGKANRGRGTEDVYFVEFFWVQMDIGSVRARHERFFDPADGALTRVTVAPDGRRVWCFFGGGSVEPALVRTGSPEDFLNGTERMIPLRGDNPSPVQILNSPDGEKLYVRSWAGDLFCLNGDTLGVEAVFSTPEPVTALSVNTASDGSFIIVQANYRVVFCHFQPA